MVELVDTVEQDDMVEQTDTTMEDWAIMERAIVQVTTAHSEMAATIVTQITSVVRVAALPV